MFRLITGLLKRLIFFYAFPWKFQIIRKPSSLPVTSWLFSLKFFITFIYFVCYLNASTLFWTNFFETKSFSFSKLSIS